jgi:NADPH:quinone reductase-like Zn-dependent oxidoreductase
MRGRRQPIDLSGVAEMKAVYTHTFEGAAGLEFGERPDPKVQPDSMLIELAAASINPVDWKALHGYLAGNWPTVMPFITGWDVAGVVTTIGPAVTDYKVGDKVIAYARKDFIGEGSWAELVNVPERCAAAAPESIDLIHASAIPLAGLTAFQALTEKLQIGAGQTIVINGAAGGVGSFAVQIASALGAQVIGTGSTGSYERIRQLGATPAPYGEAFVEGVRAAAPDGVHAVFDLYGGDNLRESKQLIKSGGRIATIADPGEAAEIGAHYLFVKPNHSQLAELVALVDSGKVKIDVQETFPLEDARKAVQVAETMHTHGKLVLTT